MRREWLSEVDHSFRPLAGISCFRHFPAHFLGAGGFRPLAGISCFLDGVGLAFAVMGFSSPSGD